MTFDEVLTQVLALLQRQGRVSYRALKRRFNLDDEYLADLKEELLFAYPVVDAEGRGLVWTGHVAGGTATASHPHKTTQQPPTPDDQPASIMESATSFCFCTTQKHLSVKIVIISMT